ncbi:hypothetical protein A4R43_22845 [Amycolatopsis albispora]|uniref:Uncharacterized protein n=1 Tax=Amycolatopsis albispora TaxID=1804986 RepID=A0A344LAB1_9PSEU|nr:hypothetical protein A4R43_22845 [Amycolatopsis albispora]
MAVEVHTHANSRELHSNAQSFDIHQASGHLYLYGPEDDQGVVRLLAAYSSGSWRSAKLD